MANRWTMINVIDELAQDGLLTGEAENAAREAVRTDRSASGAPWFVSLLMGGAAWLAAALLLAFLFAFELFENESVSFVTGAVLMVGATVLARCMKAGVFWTQLAFVFSIAGQVLFIGTIFQFTEELVPTVLAGIVLETVLFFVYPNGLHRLLSVLAVVLGIMALLVEWELSEGVHGLNTLLALGATVLAQRESRLDASRWHALRAPLLYGTSLALLALCILSLIDGYEATYWWLSALGLALVLLYAAFTIFAQQGIDRRGRALLWLVGGVVLVCIPAYQTPGILAAILVLVLGFWRGDRPLMGLASLFLAAFIIMYYYNLEITLLIKSFILAGTGVVLLALRLLWRRAIADGPEEVAGDPARAEGGAL